MAPITLIVGEHWRDQPEDKEAIHRWETDSLAALWQFKKKNQKQQRAHQDNNFTIFISQFAIIVSISFGESAR